jgi:hypothetical protein
LIPKNPLEQADPPKDIPTSASSSLQIMLHLGINRKHLIDRREGFHLSWLMFAIYRPLKDNPT